MHGRWPDVLPFLQYTQGAVSAAGRSLPPCLPHGRAVGVGDFDLGYGWD